MKLFHSYAGTIYHCVYRVTKPFCPLKKLVTKFNTVLPKSGQINITTFFPIAVHYQVYKHIVNYYGFAVA